MKSNKWGKQVGFTLIELMFVVLIIGIMSTIALPIYQDFSSKSQIQSAYRELSTLKAPLEIALLKGDDSIDSSTLGWITDSSRLVHSEPTVFIDINTGISFIEAILDGNVQPVAKNTKIKLVRSVQSGWGCNVTKSNSPAWKNSFAPKQCQVVE